jgi:hypothetical protein
MSDGPCGTHVRRRRSRIILRSTGSSEPLVNFHRRECQTGMMGQDEFFAAPRSFESRRPRHPDCRNEDRPRPRQDDQGQSKAVRGHTIMLTQSGHRKLVSANNAVGTTIWPTTIIVSQAGPSSVLIPPSAHRMTNIFRPDTNSSETIFPRPHAGHLPDIARTIAGQARKGHIRISHAGTKLTRT